jgi:RNA recognition motif-containing protein
LISNLFISGLVQDVARFAENYDVLIGITLGLCVGYLAGAQVRRVRSIGSGRPRRKTGSADCVEIYVGNLSYETAEDQLRREFERFGKVKSARIISNRFNRKSKGFGFVEMPIREEAEAAIKALHDKDIQGRKLRVNEARNKTP